MGEFCRTTESPVTCNSSIAHTSIRRHPEPHQPQQKEPDSGGNQKPPSQLNYNVPEELHDSDTNR
jgi:hypothetical protein